MTEQERDKRIAEIKSDQSLPLPMKARQIELIITEFRVGEHGDGRLAAEVRQDGISIRRTQRYFPKHMRFKAEKDGRSCYGATAEEAEGKLKEFLERRARYQAFDSTPANVG